ncbi:methyltransferase, MtaA/CmuA family [Desulfatibacillum alkenivorans DSM 16219]|jgi:MtaA/CmuA family methyltransferase|uniref:Methyltransferase, MtaA/CmuA family n=1 Tax=Desulfatibacillum alkenivorans DSM 16219 TaxID=1121393 RepID=A0A1M6LS68_9BACT|nr:uroporphyrinogen decarboxylase family protein [Desulfatibacillum alkenivorans]SHJ73942.1 methyltransferase, MtaA/CmuA family [Desulfatibacillum alkenivorans DSM 16219]
MEKNNSSLPGTACAPSHKFAGVQAFPINALPAVQLVSEDIAELSHSFEAKWKAVSRYYERVNSDLLFFFSDIAIQAEAMGARALFASDNMPAIKAAAPAILTPRAADVPRMQINAQVVRAMAQGFPGRSIAGLVYGPFTALGQAMGEQEVLRSVRDRREELHPLLEKAFLVAESYAALLMDAGADVLWISDPLAALLPPDAFEECAGGYLHDIFAMAVTGKTMLHICGDVSELIKPMVETGVSGISFDQCMDLLAVEDQVPRDVAIIGNLEPVEVVGMASAEYTAEASRDLVSVMGILPNFILSTGCAVPPGAPLENVEAFVNAGKQAMDEVQNKANILRTISQKASGGDGPETVELVREALYMNVDPLLVAHSGLIRSVRKSSALYETRQCYLPEILLTVDAFYQGMELLRPMIAGQGGDSVDVVIGTVKGDLHSIGKDLVRIMLEANGFGVLDLGVDVSAGQFAQAVREHSPLIVGLSAFITSARRLLPGMIGEIRAAGSSGMKVLVGGAAVNGAVASEVGADGFSPEAVSAARLVRGIVKAVRRS